jgi:polyisoprenyl-teichoic acid--peptidoglycan teichoic acid transferase
LRFLSLLNKQKKSMSSYLPTPKSKKPAVKPVPPQEPKPVSPPPEEPTPLKPAVESAPLTRQGIPEWLRGSLTVVYVAILLVVGFVAFSYTRSFVANNGTLLNPFVPTPNSTPLKGALGVTPSLPPLIPPAAKPWNGVDRVTILVMGLDARDVGDDCKAHPNPTEPARSDTMLLMSMDPITKTAGVLSIPRDLYVEIPGFGFDRINTAFFDAMTNRLPGGGPALAEKTVENLLGMPVDYYAVIDFNSFTSMVDEIGGIDINIPYDNMQIAPCGAHIETLFQGNNHFSGAEALAYARNRHASATGNTGGSDFDRAARTQQVIFAIRDKVLKLNMLPTLIAKAPTLYDTLSKGIQTNLTLDQYLSLAMIAKDVTKENIHTGVIGPDQLLSQETITDAQVLIPNYDKIRELRNKIFDSNIPRGYNVPPPANLGDLAPAEKLNIQILNGSGVTGLAGATKDYLLSHGFSDANITVGNAAWIANTQMIDLTGSLFTNTARYFIQLMNISEKNRFSKPAMDSDVDLQIVLGADWKIPQG